MGVSYCRLGQGGKRARDVAQWQGTCSAHTGPGFHAPPNGKKNGKEEGVKEEEEEEGKEGGVPWHTPAIQLLSRPRLRDHKSRGQPGQLSKILSQTKGVGVLGM